MKLRGLRQMRQRSGLSISQLAERTELRRDTITRLEHGKEEPQPYAVRRLAAALGASTAELVGVAVLQPDMPVAFHHATPKADHSFAGRNVAS